MDTAGKKAETSKACCCVSKEDLQCQCCKDCSKEACVKCPCRKNCVCCKCCGCCRNCNTQGECCCDYEKSEGKCCCAKKP